MALGTYSSFTAKALTVVVVSMARGVLYTALFTVGSEPSKV